MRLTCLLLLCLVMSSVGCSSEQKIIGPETTVTAPSKLPMAIGN